MSTARLEALRAKLAAREGKAEYAKNCEAIRAEIARLENSAARPVSGMGSDGDDGA